MNSIKCLRCVAIQGTLLLAACTANALSVPERDRYIETEQERQRARTAETVSYLISAAGGDDACDHDSEFMSSNVCTSLIAYANTVEFSGSGVRGRFSFDRGGAITTFGERAYVENDDCGTWDIESGSWEVITHILSADEFLIRLTLSGTDCGSRQVTMRGTCDGTTTATAWFSSSFVNGNVTVTKR
ncbi:hypothetical protein WME75_26065 [Sorangium sp. So ce1014]|uniref:hypothetical protein n=1 Tax=Sorangium sp. So ce1014 TaxID=3133326 RepID=UPI003F620765